MNRFKKFFYYIFLFFSSELLAQEKIAILDLKHVLNQNKAGKGAQDFKKSYNQNLKNLKIEASLKKETDLLSKKTVLSKEDYTKKRHARKKGN